MVTMPRGATLAGRLAALGFADTVGADRLLTEDLRLDAIGQDAPLVAAIAAAADPDLALAGLARLAGPAPDEELLGRLRGDETLPARLIAVLGVSSALAEHLRRHRGDWRLLGQVGGQAGNESGDQAGGELAAATPDELRVAYRRRLLVLAAEDLTGAASLHDVLAGLADLARRARRAALRIARVQLPPDAAPCRLAIIAMGKCGARELNYASDVDVI